jgi:orotidine-5'-phosphate decarboxylase
MSTTNNTSKVIVALDFPEAMLAEQFVEKLSPGSCKLKIGKELFTQAGPSFVETLVKNGFDVFLDLKFHDIPNTVASACSVAADLGVWMINVHASGGRRMMESAREAIDKKSQNTKPLLIAVTILTSLDQSDLLEIGFSGAPAENVERLALLAKDSGLDGVVCSPKEAGLVSKACGKEFALVTPGVRLAGNAKGDQKRVMTPVDAIQAGSHYLVIGRSITQAVDPHRTLLSINEDIINLT